MSTSRKRALPAVLSTKKKDEDLQNLYVFGYECKIFKDDEKALYIEQGKHLIPWMGEANLLIDRYDGRGHLHDLRPYDADHKPIRNTKLSEEERQTEAACDEERYMELDADWMEKILYEEEELKRLHEALGEDSYGAVGFSYDQRQDDQPQDQEEEDEDEEYEPAEELHVPPEFVIPETVKINAIIEKTASFISKHGTQMEIMIKTKQKDNAQFDFLYYDNMLFPYYRHMVHMIKCGRYKPDLEPKRRRKTSTDDNAGYLHPSLVQVSSTSQIKDSEPVDILSAIYDKLPASQIGNTPYAALVQMMSRHTGVLGRASPQPGPATDWASPEPRVAPCQASPQPGAAPGWASPQPGGATQTLMSSSAGVYPTMHPSFPDPQPTSAAEQPDHVEVDSEQRLLPPVPGVEPVVLPPPTAHRLHARCSYPCTPAVAAVAAVAVSDPAAVTRPAPDVQLIVDKMASYVAKNGPEFEIVVKSKTDARFDFLQPWHEHYAYYEQQKQLYLQEMRTASRPVEEEDGDGEDNDSEDSGDQSSKGGVSFCIKVKDTETSALAGQRAVLYESSEEEAREGDGTDCTETSEMTDQPSATEAVRRADRPQLTAEQLQKKQVEQRLRDRLTGAARGKLAQAGKDKQLQAERKRKAAMFISLLRGTETGGQDATPSDAASSDVVGGSRDGSPLRNPRPAQLYVEDTRPPQLYVEDCIAPYPAPYAPLYLEPDRPQLYVEDRMPPYPDPDRPQLYVKTDEGRPDDYPPTSTRHRHSHHRHRSPHKPTRSGHRSHRDRARSPKSHRRKRSKTPPSAYNRTHRSKSKSPSSMHPSARERSQSDSRHRSSHSKKHKSSKHSSRSNKSSKSSYRERKSRHRSSSPISKRSRVDGTTISSDDSMASDKRVNGLLPGSKAANTHGRSPSPDDCIIIDDEPSPVARAPRPVVSSNGTASPVTASPVTVSLPASDLPQDLMSKVRAILKASRELT